MPIPTMLPVESRLIHSIGHDAGTNTTYIRFLNKGQPGKLYRYPNQTAAQFDALRNAESVGKHFGAHIKPLDNHEFVPETGGA